MRSELGAAVDKLLLAATYQWEEETQLFMVRAAHYGKTFLGHKEYKFNDFVKTLKDLRIYNNLRKATRPRLLTFFQYKKIEPNIINLLLKHRNFQLASEISSFLGEDDSRIFEKWALLKIKSCSFLKNEEQEAAVYDEISYKLSSFGKKNISYLTLARKAFEREKRLLGNKLLNHEKSAVVKIPQFLEIKEYNEALKLAFESLDRFVIFSVLEKIYLVHKPEDYETEEEAKDKLNKYLSLLAKFPEKKKLIEKFLKTGHGPSIEDYYEHIKDYEGLYYMNMELFFKTDSPIEQDNALNNTSLISKKHGSKDSLFFQKYSFIVNDYCSGFRLLKKEFVNNKLISPSDSYNLSPFEFYKQAIKNGRFKEVDASNKKLFKAPIDQIGLVKLRALLENDDVEQIKDMGTLSKNFELTPLDMAQTSYLLNKQEIAVTLLKPFIGKQIKDIEEESFKNELLRNMKRYGDIIECIMASVHVENKDELVRNILREVPEFEDEARRLGMKYKVSF